MTFRIPNPYSRDLLQNYESKMFLKARQRIRQYKTGASEIALNNYCIKKYKKPLKHMCLLILYKSKFYKGFENEVIVKIPRRDLDELAKLITYGTGKLQGSGILQNAFKPL